jgi:tetratricopeptide (TPR) repeat protein
MNCPNCNAELRDGTKFCASCGARTELPEQAPPGRLKTAPGKLKETIVSNLWIVFLLIAVLSAASFYFYYYKPGVEYKIGERHYRVGEYAKCADRLEKVVGMRPKMDAAWVILSECRLESGDKKSAEKTVIRALRWNKESPALLALLGRYYYEDRKFDNAEKSLRPALKSEPANRTANQYMGLIYLRKHQYKSALGCFKKSLIGASATDRIIIRTAAGDIYFRQNNLACAEKTYKAILADNVNDIPVSLNLIRVYLKLGKFEESKKETDRVTMIDPENKELRKVKNDVYKFVREQWVIEYILERKKLDNYFVENYSALENYVNRLNTDPRAFMKKTDDPELAQILDDTQGLLASYQKLAPPPDSYIVHTQTMSVLTNMADTINSLQVYVTSGEQDKYETAANMIFSLKKIMQRLTDTWNAESRKMNIEKIMKNAKPKHATGTASIPGAAPAPDCIQ